MDDTFCPLTFGSALMWERVYLIAFIRLPPPAFIPPAHTSVNHLQGGLLVTLRN